jgi:hypothetical protein
MVIPTITFANSSSVSDYVDPSFQDYLRKWETASPTEKPEFLKLVYVNCRNQAFTVGTGTRGSGPGRMMTGKP